ncbi:MAG: HEPN domain-containing protein [Chitinispirillaceae bacterium]|nr:HEPN domain-containing protein [Chitinispirillaceae bacterium]
MIDIQKQIDYWRTGAAEEWDIAADLFSNGRTRHGLFFLHLTLEKIIKAHVCRTTGKVAPKLHNLVRLAELTGIQFTDDDRKFLAIMLRFNIEGRYPDSYEDLPSASSVDQIRQQCDRMYKWLLQQL